jgi:hypothetical protein
MKRTYIWDTEQHKLVEYEKRIPDPRVWIIPDIEPHWDDNMGHEPVYVKSRRHKMSLLKERGLAIK